MNELKNECCDSPDISVIIPCYNADKYIQRCVNSIINQTLTNIEIIIINDCSTDNSFNIVNSLVKSDSRIKLINNLSNIGQGKSRNIAIDYARGKYLTFIDADDYIYYKNYFKDCIDFIVQTSSDILITPYIRIKDNIEKRDHIFVEKLTSTKASSKFLNREFGTHGSCGKFYKTNLIKNNNITFAEYGYSQDVIFVFNALKNSTNINTIDYYGYTYLNDNFSSTRPFEVTAKHLYSSFRLLLEILTINHKSIKENQYIYIYKFLITWHKDHLPRIEHYLRINVKENNTEYQIIFSTLKNIYQIISPYIGSNLIKKHIINYNKNTKISASNKTFYIYAVSYMNDLCNALKMITYEDTSLRTLLHKSIDKMIIFTFIEIFRTKKFIIYALKKITKTVCI